MSVEKYGSNYTSKMSHVTNAKGQEQSENHFKTFAEVDKAIGGNFMRTEFKSKAKKGKHNNNNNKRNCDE